MTKAERILEFMREQEQAIAPEKRTGVDTDTIAQALGLWRSDVLQELNLLVAGGILRKAGARPVRFFLEEQEPLKSSESAASGAERPAFERIIGYNGSLELQTQLARAAAIYPPMGLHTLIVGSTGVGKTLMAEEMWRFICETRRGGAEEVPFVVFNCAEYADNPQLLLSQLFGYEKGAFTGATEEHAGILDRADNGVLFLDEIHRLTPTGQEMLFTVIDRGIFRRLGGVANHKVRVMIIGATTEAPDSALLTTFQRRIPVLIQIPPLRERPLRERFDLTMRFLAQEATRIQKPIQVTYGMLKHMVGFDSTANIGDLKNEIQICCARGYLAHLAKSETETVVLDVDTMSRKMNLSLTQERNLDLFLSDGVPADGITVQPGEVPVAFGGDRENQFDFYHFISEKLQSTKTRTAQNAISNPPTSSDPSAQKQFRELLKGREVSSRENLFSTVSPDVWTMTNELIQLATLTFNQFYPRNIVNSLAFYLQQTKQFAKAGRVVFDCADQQLARDYPEERKLVESAMPRISQMLGTQMTEGEKVLLAFLLGQRAMTETSPRVVILSIAYGEHVAAGKAAFVNQLLGETLVRALEMPDDDYLHILDVVVEAIKRYDEGQGVLLLTDINLLFYSDRELSERSGIPCVVLPSVDSTILLEAAKNVLAGDAELSVLAAQIRTVYPRHIRALFSDSELPRPYYPVTPQDRRSVIITFCITGTGSAKLARQLLLQRPAVTAKADIIPLGLMSDIQTVAKNLGSRLKLVVGFLNPHIPGIPFLSIEHLLTEDYYDWIAARLEDHVQTCADNLIPREKPMTLDDRLEIVNQNLQHFTPSLDTDQVSHQAKQTLERILAVYEDTPAEDFAVRVYIHLITMFERLLTIEPYPLTENEKANIASRPNDFQRLSALVQDACNALSLPFDENEVYYLMLTLPDPETHEPYFI